MDHFLDCLVVQLHFPQTGMGSDLVTGGTMLALALAICRPDVQIALFEKSPDKCQFLASLFVSITNFEIRGILEPKSLHDEISFITTRIFKHIAIIFEFTRTLTKNDGCYQLYKGHQARLGPLKVRIHTLPITCNADERHLVELHS